MHTWIAAAGLVAVAAITPGPNNLIVMRAAARSGVRGAVPAIAGVVLGGLALLTVVVLGGGVLFAAMPWLHTAIAACGCLYLAGSGALLVARTFTAGAASQRPDETGIPARAAELFSFQFLNPKSWALVSTAATAFLGDGAAAALAALAPLLVVIPVISLILWSALGSLLARALAQPNVRRWFDRAMGLVLVASAVVVVEG